MVTVTVTAIAAGVVIGIFASVTVALSVSETVTSFVVVVFTVVMKGPAGRLTKHEQALTTYSSGVTRGGTEVAQVLRIGLGAAWRFASVAMEVEGQDKRGVVSLDSTSMGRRENRRMSFGGTV
jgi:hypothetical protein